MSALFDRERAVAFIVDLEFSVRVHSPSLLFFSSSVSCSLCHTHSPRHNDPITVATVNKNYADGIAMPLLHTLLVLVFEAVDLVID